MVTANARGIVARNVDLLSSKIDVTANVMAGIEVVDVLGKMSDSRLLRNGTSGQTQAFVGGGGDREFKFRNTRIDGATVSPRGVLIGPDARPTVHQCDIEDHAVFGMSFDPPAAHSFELLIKAQKNWWGNPNGPDDPSIDIPGGYFNVNSGFERVSNGINYKDWLPAPATQ